MKMSFFINAISIGKYQDAFGRGSLRRNLFRKGFSLKRFWR